MFINVKRRWQGILEYLMIVVGCFIMGFAFSVFMEPRNISSGGFSGIALIVNVILNNLGITFLTTSIIYLILNAFLFIYAFKSMGRKFAIKALVGIVVYSVGMEIFNIIDIGISYDNLISSVFGGAFMGIGLGLVVRFGGSTGGSDMIACILKKKNSHYSIGKITLLVDILVVILTVIIFPNGLELLPYIVITLLIYSVAIDFVNERYKQVKAFNIITSKPNELAELLMKNLARGCTLSSVRGMYNNEEKASLMCLVSKFQIAELKNIIKNVDPSAFVYSVDINEVMGDWTDSEEIMKNRDKTNLEQKETKKIDKKNNHNN